MNKELRQTAESFRNALLALKADMDEDQVTIHDLISTLDHCLNGGRIVLETPSGPRSHTKNSFAKMSIVNICASILKVEGPMKTTDLLLALNQRGKTVGGKKPWATLHATLAKSDLFSRTSKKLWRLNSVKKTS